ncbi:GDPGTP exchange factor Sec2p [Metarhizium robertsii ARSEF 23]|uniref:GDPGTP exchange factor Sec2p n=1 Tax=Metarhizium robertsii (strain ARSEF 23 / ATCC MYA-3075) TaxID=655844 RepID=A0A0B2XF62_METRA|nr:GDPGTP exchange factor Sec2p [Metarhizium robertsii ARSEF 23]KHO10649.1 GDPGTP exchange factor Sec2p [Metarhizium robertsii ARSEF 23]
MASKTPSLDSRKQWHQLRRRRLLRRLAEDGDSRAAKDESQLPPLKCRRHVASSIKILDEIATGLAKEKEEMVRNAKERDALSERGNNAREVERAVTLRRQLNKWIDRTEKLCEQSNQKAQEAKAKMHELRAIRRKLTEEHTEKSKEMERLDILGAQMEKTSISCRGSTQRRKGEATQQG